MPRTRSGWPPGPALGTILFVLFVGPGPVVGLAPPSLSGWRGQEPFFGWEPRLVPATARSAVDATDRPARRLSRAPEA
jgi:hypothetical protein